MRIDLALVGKDSKSARSARGILSGAVGAVAAALTVACSGTLAVGEPVPDRAPDVTDPPSASVPSLSDAATPEPSTYAWSWANPERTGVALRAISAVATGEIWSVGDEGTVLREVSGKVSVMRVGGRDEVLNAVSGRGPDDVWVGGARGGTVGLLLHWDGVAWSENFGAGGPVDALQSLPQGGVAYAAAGNGLVIDANGRALVGCGLQDGVSGIREVWVSPSGQTWFAGIGTGRIEGYQCREVDDQRTIGLWGDGARVVAASTTPEGRVQLREWVDDHFVARGAPFGRPLRDVRGGKLVAGDASGRVRVVLHYHAGAPNEPLEGYATFDPATGVVGEVTLATGFSTWAREVLYGLTTVGGEVHFVGERGLGGRFVGDAFVPNHLRPLLHNAMPTPDGTLFALCAAGTGTVACRWDATTGWSALPGIAEWSPRHGLATSEGTLLVGGIPWGSTQPDTRRWNGTSWALEPLETKGRMSFLPLFASAPNDVWGCSDAATVHFDGTGWRTVSPSPSSDGDRMADGRAADDVWFLDRNEGLSHWDGASYRHVTSLPAEYAADELPHGLVAVDDGVWLVGQHVFGVKELLHFDGASWRIVKLPPLTHVDAIARGPDGRIRVLGPPMAWGTSIYVLDGERVRTELELPASVRLRDFAPVRDALFAIGAGGATLRLAKVERKSVP